MQKDTATNGGPNLMYSERWEIDHLCHRFGLSRATARNIVQSYPGDRLKMQQVADRLEKMKV